MTARGTRQPDATPLAELIERFRQSRVPTMVLRRDGQIVMRNQALVRLTGYTVADAPTAARLVELVFPNPEYRASALSSVRLSLSGRLIEPEEFLLNCRNDRRIVARAATMLFDAGMIVQYQDVSASYGLVRGPKGSVSLAWARPEVRYRGTLKEWRTNYVSPGTISMLGYEPWTVLAWGREDWWDRVCPEDRPRLTALLAAMTQHRRGVKWSIEYRFRHANGTYRWMSDMATISYDREGVPEGIQGVLRDVTDRESYHEALQERVANFQTVAEHAGEGIFIARNDGRHVYVNDYACKLTGYTARELQRLRRKDLLVLSDVPRVEKFSRLRLGGGAAPGRYETTIRRKDGSMVPVEVTASRIVWQGEQCTLGLVRDISERRDMVRQLLEISNQEKREIGHVLHDSLGQILTGIGLQLSVLEQDLAANGNPAAARVRRLKELSQTAIRQARGIARGLSPLDVAGRGLDLALERLALDTCHIYGLDCRYERKGSGTIDDQRVATHLYYIAQESITNAVRHGCAGKIVVQLRIGKKGGRLLVSDNGVGFGAAPESLEGMGLRIMRYRARMVDGELTIRGGAKRGTTVEVCFT